MPKFTKKAAPSPINNIRARLTDLKAEKELLVSSINQCQSEKAEIEDTLPILIERLINIHTSVEDMCNERSTYDKAILELEDTYAMIFEGQTEALMDNPEGKLQMRNGSVAMEEEDDEETAALKRELNSREANHAVDML
ncbi:hypothetical protein TrVE_jg12929 [Triparma verrucosa]|uniref:Uncharacterized protein n=2 Tax=Triparma TaxID=722752 RepID=A0A9W7F274_9STRA|nr:hypothetical protein TrVE_jg12929 [Triparma verrucosa]GMH98807.1 hypothetical protein TrST_g11150 [Triparma strigata]|mmetsp:Transcript_18257/g.33933  ORF Transcript_18257/g.33933 Transcript_18257/m.33933 type:complete len:139 (-) Transcript_18257:35-451(-)